MTLRMADDISAANLPVGYDAYAGYVNGNWPDYNAIVQRFPNAKHLSITVFLANEGDCMDIENGDATPNEAATFVNERIAAGIFRPCLYASISVMPQVVANLVGIPRANYRLWSAHYGQGMHICGPNSCAYSGASTPECDGTQWANYTNYDDSILADDFFGVNMATKPATPEPVVDHSEFFVTDPAFNCPSLHVFMRGQSGKLYHAWFLALGPNTNTGWHQEEITGAI